MNNPKVSVIIPTYLGAQYLDETLVSVFAQTYPNFEVIVVNDASPDDTDAVIARYTDPRLRYIVHEQNRGAGVARATATEAAEGELISFLDHDDVLHPDKLALHVQHFVNDAQLGASYSGRFELNPSSPTVREIWNVPEPVTLGDLLLGFPIIPTDLVLTRDWALRPDIQSVHEVFHGGEIIRYGRLYLDGCKFGQVPRALSYHRYHAGRVQRQIEKNCRDYIFAQDVILDDERCPADVQALRSKAHTMSYLVWAGYALCQSETELAQKLLRAAAVETPTLADGPFCELARFIFGSNVENDFGDHESVMRNVYRQLPLELTFDAAQLEYAVGRGYLVRGARCLIWGRDELGKSCFDRAQAMQARVDEPYIASVVHHLLNYETEFGSEAMQCALDRVAPHIDRVSGKRTAARMQAMLAYNRALRNFTAQEYRRVPGDCVQAIVNDPRLLTNRGVLSVFVRSLTQVATRGSAA
jgi:glycosyltransferase involved in cell wall biosynthesis